ncbi:ATP-binding protein [Alkalihalobacillus sp. MEB130]|uniref:ATP-binding protein n=1 Tax=Alkalihalobacillus sp. MEB130 TaxID=2976704 RepID=UPI0028DF857D|nr:ATP-binding protein [Alkalihalobacillus sp. MEB130]MDT8859823.1 ATP-binding protein [Alkalihalobacillus sp. MEB130]
MANWKTFFDQSIRRKYLTVIGVTLATVIIISIGFIYYMLTTQSQLDAERDYLQERVEVIDKLNNTLNHLILNARAYYLIHEEANKVKVDIHLDELKSIIDYYKEYPIHSEEYRFGVDLNRFYMGYKYYTFDRVSKMALESRYDDIRVFNRQNQSSDDIREFLEAMEILKNETTEELDHVINKSISQLKFFTIGQVIFSSLVLILFIFLIGRILRDVIRPIEELEEATDAVAKGESFKLTKINRNDEIGSLSNAFIKMARTIQEKEEELTAQNEELMAQQDELHYQQDQLETTLSASKQTKEKLERYYKLSQALTFTLDKQELVNELLYNLNELYSFDASIIALTAEDVYTSKGLPKETVERFRRNVIEQQYARLQDEEYYVIKRLADSSERGISTNELYCYDFYTAFLDGNHQEVGVFAATRVGRPFSEEEMNEIHGLMNQVSLSFERIKMYEAVEYSRKINQDIIDNVNEGILFVSATGDMIHHNDTLCKLGTCSEWELGNIQTKDEWINDFVARVNEPAELSAFFNESLEHCFDETKSMTYSIEGDMVRYIDVYATSVFQKGEKVGTVFVHRDITKEHEVDQMKSELVSTVSHELRTPLSSVLGFTELLITKDLKKERQKKYLTTIHKEAKRLTNLINDFLDLQRMEAGQQSYEMEPCKVDEVAMEVVRQFKHEKNHDVFFIDEAQNVVVHGDRERLIQVFTNLMSNAIKFSPDGGDVKIHLRNEQHLLHITIQDQGLGIPEDEVKLLFKKFHRIDNSERRKIGGTGLGLAICKEIIEKHQGTIWIESTEGKGTTIHIKMPLLETRQEELVSDEVLQGQDSVNVMIVEDDTSLALLLSEELKGKGFKVIHHSEPSRALKDAMKIPLVGIVVDLMLGEEMSGWDLIQCLKEEEKTKHIPIVISSALDKPEEKVEKYQIDKYLTKPFPPHELSTTIAEFLLHSETGDVLFPDNKKE